MGRIAFSIYMIVLVWSVLFFGAVHTYAYTFAYLGIFIATVFVLIENTRKNPENGAIELKILKSPLNPLFLMILCFLFLQTMPLPESILKTISFQSLVIGNKSLPASGMSIPGNPIQQWFSISPQIYPVRQSIIRWTAYGLMFWGLTQILNSKKRIEITIFVILITGGLEALYGLGQTYSQSGDILWFSKSYYGSKQSVTGTYINRNHFAGFMEMCVLLAIGFASALSPGENRSGALSNKSSFRGKLAQLLSREQMYSKRIFVVFAGVAVGIGLIFSASRGGMIAILAALLTLWLLFTIRKKRRRRGRIVLILLLLISTYAINIGVDYPLSRFKSIDASYLSRLRYWQNTLEIYDDYRFFGSGVGSFQYIYPGYQAVADKGRFIRYAHNDWVQWMAEAGIAGLCLIIGGLAYYIYRTLKLWKRRNDPFAVSLGVIPLVVMTALGLHSIADFNLHIPANFMMLAAVIAIGYSALHLQQHRHGEKLLFKYRTLNLKKGGALVLVLVLPIFIWTGVRTVRHFMAEAYCNTVHNSTMNRDQTPPLEEIEKAIDWDADNATYRYKLAQELMRERNEIPDTEDNMGERRKRQMKIVDALEKTVYLNPFNAEYHLRMGWEYTNFWREPDYQEKWMRAADISMERAAYFAGRANPWLHTQLGRYWTIRSASLAPVETHSDPLWHRALGHFQKAMNPERGGKRKRLLKEIKKHVFWYYPDDDYVKKGIEELN